MRAADAQPKSEKERAIYESVSKILSAGPSILADLSKYSGCEEFIRKVRAAGRDAFGVVCWCVCSV